MITYRRFTEKDWHVITEDRFMSYLRGYYNNKINVKQALAKLKKDGSYRVDAREFRFNG